MVRTEVIDNICLVQICTDCKKDSSVWVVKAALAKGGLFPVFISRQSIFGREKMLTIAIDSEDLFPLMNILGSIRHKAGITSYSINCSNSMIKWENKSIESIDHIWDDDKDIKLFCLWEDKGICFCESSSSGRVCAQLMQ